MGIHYPGRCPGLGAFGLSGRSDLNPILESIIVLICLFQLLSAGVKDPVPQAEPIVTKLFMIVV